MPHCEVGKNNGINIFYRTYGRGPIKVLLIIGLAGTHESWLPQVKGLTGTDQPNDGSFVIEDDLGNGIEVCAFDNRGVGRSSVPTKKSSYSTKRMAKDAIAVLDHLGWKEAHVFGHSMGGMIACKVAALVPNRVRSLALLNVTGGGYQCIPRLDRKTLSVALRFVRAKTPEQRAAVDLDTHFSEEYLGEKVGTLTRRAMLYQEYVKAISSSGMQSPHGLDGQLNACWNHKVTEADIESMRSMGFLVSRPLIHLYQTRYYSSNTPRKETRRETAAVFQNGGPSRSRPRNYQITPVTTNRCAPSLEGRRDTEEGAWLRREEKNGLGGERKEAEHLWLLCCGNITTN